MRIVHFSDIHAGGWLQDFSGYFDKRLLGAFNYLLRRKRHHDWSLVSAAVSKIKLLAPDIVICTGDFTSISEPNEFLRAKDALAPLVEDADFEFLYVPGNHDYYVKKPSCVSALYETFSAVNRGKFDLDDLPIHYEFKDVSFILLNEAAPVNLFKSTGIVDARSQTWLTSLFHDGNAAGKMVILVAHFPIFDKNGDSLSFRRRCENNKILQSALREKKIDISLCGHIHSHFSRWEENGSVEFCAGSLTYTGYLNLIDIDLSRNRISQEWINVLRESEKINCPIVLPSVGIQIDIL